LRLRNIALGTRLIVPEQERARFTAFSEQLGVAAHHVRDSFFNDATPKTTATVCASVSEGDFTCLVAV
jgi:hypothetical protein